MVGAGVLGLPSAMVFLGWTGGTITLVLSWFISVGFIAVRSCMAGSTLHQPWSRVWIADRQDSQHSANASGCCWDIRLQPVVFVLLAATVFRKVTNHGQCSQAGELAATVSQAYSLSEVGQPCHDKSILELYCGSGALHSAGSWHLLVLLQHCDGYPRIRHVLIKPRLTRGLFLQLYTLHQLCAMHEIGGLRMNRYRELGQYAFGGFPGYS